MFSRFRKLSQQFPLRVAPNFIQDDHYGIKGFTNDFTHMIFQVKFGTKYLKMDQVKLVEYSL